MHISVIQITDPLLLHAVPNSTRVDGTHVSEQKRAVEALTKALETEELDEKDYHIREALQLLNIENR